MPQSGTIPMCAEDVKGLAGTAIVAGEPIAFRDRELVPLVGASSYLRRRAFIGQTRESACSRGIYSLRPVGIVERRSGEERLIPVRDVTSAALAILTIAGLLVPVAVFLAAALVRLHGRRPPRERTTGLEGE